MLPEEYRILKHLVDCGGKCSIDYLETLNDREAFVWEQMPRLDRAWVLYDDADIVHGYAVDPKSIVITEAGRRAFLEEDERLAMERQQLEQKAKEEAKKEKQRLQDIRRSWWQFGFRLVFDLMLFLSGWVLGGFTFPEVVEQIKALFW